MVEIGSLRHRHRGLGLDDTEPGRRPVRGAQPVAVSARTVIARERADVWAGVTDWVRASHWMGSIEALAPQTDPVGLGTRLLGRRGGREFEATVVRWSPAQALGLRLARHGAYVNYVYRLADAEGGTLVHFDAQYYGGGVRWRLLGPMVRAGLRRIDGGQLGALKAMLEG